MANKTYGRIELPEKKAVAAAAKQTEKKEKQTEKKAVKKEKASAKTRSKALKNAVNGIDPEAALQIIPLGGLEEIGKNMTVLRCGGDAIIIDCGMSFPDDELLGVDAVIPDFAYLEQIEDELRGLVLTHGHEDHIGGIPFLLKEHNVPIYGTPLTLGFVGHKLKENGLDKTAKLNTVHAGETIQLGGMSVEFIRMNHSIPDACAIAVSTAAGVVIHTGDFKIDHTPVVGQTADLARLGEYGKKGVLALLCDSTNAERPGTSGSESHVGASFEALFNRAEGKRVIIATFSSNIQRIQQIIDFAEKHNRKIAVSGRSMVNYIAIAQELGYLTYSENTFVDIGEVSRFRPEDIVIITTGSQGEPMSALTRMAAGTHRQVSITQDDFIIISASPIPGNEKTVSRVINSLLKLGSDVIYESMYQVHASGHACQDEIKLMLTLVNPAYYMPVHGEFKHMIKNAGLAKQKGFADDHIILGKIGDVIEFKDGAVHHAGTVESGRVLVDGLGVGDVGSVVLRDRKHLANDGLVVVVCSIDDMTGSIISGPDIISRGFVYVKESEELIEEARQLAVSIIERCAVEDKRRRNEIKSTVREEIGRLMYQRTKRSPMILPVIMEI